MLDASKYDVNLIRSDISFYLWIDFHGYDFDHQNEIIPLRRNKKEFQRLEYDISPKNPTIKFYKWKLVKYKADEGLAKLWNKTVNKKDEESLKTYGLIYDSSETIFAKDYYEDESDFYEEINGNDYRLLGILNFDIDFDSYDEYKRTKKDIFDSISNACSLSLSLYNIISFILSTFYSNSFDNYKITEKILSNTKTINFRNKSRTNSIELMNDSNNTDALLPNNNEENITTINDEINGEDGLEDNQCKR